MSNALKDIRKQLKNVVIALLPEVVKQELYKDLERQVHARMDEIAKNVKETLNRLDERSKDVSGYLVRQVSQPQIIPEVKKD